MHVLFSLSRIIMSVLLLGTVLSVCTWWFHSIVTLPPWFVTTEFGTCSYQCILSSCTPISWHMLKCICALTLSCRFTYCQYWACWYYMIYCLYYYYMVYYYIVYCLYYYYYHHHHHHEY
jgi:hypothetical protein